MTDTELGKLITNNENTSELGEYWQKRYDKFLKTKYFTIHEKTMEVILSQSLVLSPITPFGHLDLTKFVSKNRSVDEVSLQNTIETAIRFLDSSLDAINFSPEAKEMVVSYRKIGIGVMNFNLYLEMRGSTSEIDEIDYLGNIISSSCYRVSENLAEEKGVCKNWQSINRIIRPKVFEYWFDRNSGEVKNGLDINEDFTSQTIALSYYEIIPRRNSNILLYPQDIEWQIWADRDDTVSIDTTTNPSIHEALINSDDESGQEFGIESSQERANKASKTTINPINILIDQSRKKISQWFGVGDKEESELETVEVADEDQKKILEIQNTETDISNNESQESSNFEKINSIEDETGKTEIIPRQDSTKIVADAIESKMGSETLATNHTIDIKSINPILDQVSFEEMVNAEVDAPILQTQGSSNKTFEDNPKLVVADKPIETIIKNTELESNLDLQMTVKPEVEDKSELKSDFEPSTESTVKQDNNSINPFSTVSTNPKNIELPESNFVILPESEDILATKMHTTPSADSSIIESYLDPKLIIKEQIKPVKVNSSEATKPTVVVKSIFSPRQIVKIINNQSPLVGQLFQVSDVQFNPSNQSYQISLDSQDAVICKESELVSVDLKSLERELVNRPEVSVQAVVLSDDGSKVLVDNESKNLPQTPLRIGKNPEAEMSLFLAKRYNLHSDFVEVSTINFESGILHIVYHVKLINLEEVKDLDWVELSEIQISSAKITLDKIIDKIRRWQSSAKQKAAQILESTLPLEIAKAETRFVLQYEKKTAEYKFAIEADAAKIRTECESQIRSLQSLLSSSKLTQETGEKNLLNLSIDYKNLVSEKNSLIEKLTTLEESTISQITKLEEERRQAIEAANIKTLNPLPIPSLEGTNAEKFHITRNNLFAPTLVPKAIQPTHTATASKPNSNLAQIMSSQNNYHSTNEPISEPIIKSTSNDDSVNILLKMKKVNSRY